MNKKRGKQTINTYKPQQLKETFEADVTIWDSGNTKELKDKQVSIYKGARGLDLLVIDGAVYPTRTFRDSVTPSIEKRFKSFIAYILVAGVFLMLLEQIWIMNLLTDENYFNPVSIFLIVAVCGALLFVLRTLKKERVAKLTLQKYRKQWIQPNQADYSDRTIEKYRGFTGSMVIGGLFVGFIIAFVITFSMFSAIQLSLLDSVNEANQWIVTSHEEAEKVLELYYQSRYSLDYLFYIILAVSVVVVSAFGVIMFFNVRAMQTERKKNLVYMGDLANVNKETGKFQPVHAYVYPFEDDQKDVNTIDAVTLQQNIKEGIHYEIDENPELGLLPESEVLLFDDQEEIETLEIEDARQLILKTYEELTKLSEKDQKARRVVDILTDYKAQLITFYEISNLLIHQTDSLEAENNGLKKGQEQLIDKLEEKIISTSGAPIVPKKKKLDLGHILLIAFSSALFIGLIVLLVLMFTGGVTV